MKITQQQILVILGILLLALGLTLWSKWDLIQTAIQSLSETSDLTNNNFRSFLSNPWWPIGISFVLFSIALYKILEYIRNFNPANFFMEGIVPTILLYFAFQWMDVLRWIE